jgi:hypothetical protein
MEVEMVSTKWQRQRENQRELRELIKREHEAELWGQRGDGAIFDEPLMLSYGEWLRTWWAKPLLDLWDEKLVKQVYCFYLALAMIEIAKNGGPKIRERREPANPGSCDPLIRAAYLGERPPRSMVGPDESDEVLRKLDYLSSSAPADKKPAPDPTPTPFLPVKAPESPALPISRPISLEELEAKRKALREEQMLAMRRMRGPLEIFGRRI